MFNILFVGCGGMGIVWMDYILSRDDTKIIGLCDIVPEHAEAYKKRYNLTCPIYDNIDKALSCCSPTLTIDCTTPDSHEKITITALNAGSDVLGEKPMAPTREAALRQLAVVNSTNKHYAVMQNRIYLPFMRTIRSQIADGLLGRLGYISADFFIGAHFGGFREIMDNVLILDMAVHTFYQARFLIGSNPISCYCHEFNPSGSWYKGNASAVCIFEFENNVVFKYAGSWCSEGFNTSWESDWRIIGEKGTIRWDGGANATAEIVKQSLNPRVFEKLDLNADWNGRHGHLGCFDEMFTSLRQNRPAETDSAETYVSTNMVYAAIESSRAGKKVFL